MGKRDFWLDILLLLVMVLILGVGSAMFCGIFCEKNIEVNSAKAENTGMQTEAPDGKAELESVGEGNERKSEAKKEERTEHGGKSTGEKMQEIMDRQEEYPDYLLETLDKYPETIDFVWHYLERKGKTVSLEPEKYEDGEIPLFIQWDRRWGYASYGDSLIGVAGCGPVCLSMVASGLMGDNTYDPKWMARFSERNDYWVEGSGTAWLLMSEGAEQLGLQAERISLQPSAIQAELEAGHPIICSMKPGDFTYTGHFIVLAGMEGNKIVVNDPNSKINSKKRWKMDKLLRQMKAAWSYRMR